MLIENNPKSDKTVLNSQYASLDLAHGLVSLLPQGAVLNEAGHLLLHLTDKHTHDQQPNLSSSQHPKQLYLFPKLCFLSLLILLNLLQSGSLFCTVTVRAREESEYTIKLQKCLKCHMYVNCQ